MSTFFFFLKWHFFWTTQPPPLCRYGPAQNHWSQNGWFEYLKNDQICGVSSHSSFFGQGNVIKIWNATMSSTFGQPLLMDAAVSKAVDLAAKLRHTVDQWRTRFGVLIWWVKWPLLSEATCCIILFYSSPIWTPDFDDTGRHYLPLWWLYGNQIYIIYLEKHQIPSCCSDLSCRNQRFCQTSQAGVFFLTIS